MKRVQAYELNFGWMKQWGMLSLTPRSSRVGGHPSTECIVASEQWIVVSHHRARRLPSPIPSFDPFER